MSMEKLIVICQSGGQFVSNADGTLSYTGGEAHAVDIDRTMSFQDFTSCIAEFWKCDLSSIAIKYFLPINKKTLITISSDADLQRMINFYKDSNTTDVYIERREIAIRENNAREMKTPKRMKKRKASETLNTISAPIGNELAPSDYATSPKLTVLWENVIRGVGQQFNTVAQFRDALRKYAIAHSFSYKLLLNDPRRVTAKCKGSDCPWRIHASKVANTDIFMIKKFNNVHTCGGNLGLKDHPQASKRLIASIVKDRIRDTPNYKPKEIANDIFRDYGVRLSYSQARRGKELASEQVHGSYKDAYNHLPWYCEKLMDANPRSVAVYCTSPDRRFKRLFLAFHASLHGFQHGCRPLLFLGSTPLRSTYRGTLLAATTIDGDDGVFPVASAIVDIEDEDNWHWFLVQLRSVVTTTTPLTIVAELHPGLCKYVQLVFENCFHAFCVRAVTDNLTKAMKGTLSPDAKKAIVSDIYSAAFACSVQEYNECIDRIKAISQEAYDWVLASDPNCWANCWFRGKRYNHITSNIADFFNSWTFETSELPIIQTLDRMRDKLIELIQERQSNALQWPTRLTPSAEEKLLKESLQARCLNVTFLFGSKFEVRDECINTVDLQEWDCTCNLWRIVGIPCGHAIAAINYTNRSPYEYCSPSFTSDTYRMTYTESINVIPSLEYPDQNEMCSDQEPQVLPPSIRRPPGRPKTKHVESQIVIVGRRSLRCSLCKGAGHNRKSCKAHFA